VEKAIYAVKQTPTDYLIYSKPEDKSYGRCTAEKGAARWNSMIRELVILEHLDSPYIIKVIEFIKTKNNFYMIQEFANGGSL